MWMKSPVVFLCVFGSQGSVYVSIYIYIHIYIYIYVYIVIIMIHVIYKICAGVKTPSGSAWWGFVINPIVVVHMPVIRIPF